eukprot:gene7818-1017_t
MSRAVQMLQQLTDPSNGNGSMQACNVLQGMQELRAQPTHPSPAYTVEDSYVSKAEAIAREEITPNKTQNGMPGDYAVEDSYVRRPLPENHAREQAGSGEGQHKNPGKVPGQQGDRNAKRQQQGGLSEGGAVSSMETLAWQMMHGSSELRKQLQAGVDAVQGIAWQQQVNSVVNGSQYCAVLPQTPSSDVALWILTDRSFVELPAADIINNNNKSSSGTQMLQLVNPSPAPLHGGHATRTGPDAEGGDAGTMHNGFGRSPLRPPGPGFVSGSRAQQVAFPGFRGTQGNHGNQGAGPTQGWQPAPSASLSPNELRPQNPGAHSHEHYLSSYPVYQPGPSDHNCPYPPLPPEPNSSGLGSADDPSFSPDDPLRPGSLPPDQMGSGPMPPGHLCPGPMPAELLRSGHMAGSSLQHPSYPVYPRYGRPSPSPSHLTYPMPSSEASPQDHQPVTYPQPIFNLYQAFLPPEYREMGYMDQPYCTYSGGESGSPDPMQHEGPASEMPPGPPSDASGAPYIARDARGAPLIPRDSTGAPFIPRNAGGAPSIPRGSSGAPFIPQDASGAPFMARDARGAPSIPRESSGAPFIPRNVCGAPSIPRGSSGAPFIPRDASGAPFIARDARGAPSIPRDATGAPFIPRNVGGAPSIPRGSSGAPFVPRDAVGVLQNASGESFLPRDARGAPFIPRGASGAASFPRDASGAPSYPRDASWMPPVARDVGPERAAGEANAKRGTKKRARSNPPMAGEDFEGTACLKRLHLQLVQSQKKLQADVERLKMQKTDSDSNL